MLSCAAVLLDLDGVLIDSTGAVQDAWGDWARTHGLEREMVLAVAHGRRTADTIRAVAPDLDADAEATRIETREVRTADRVAAYAGAARLLDALPEGRWAMVTSATHALATARLHGAGLPAAPVLVTAEDVTDGKPDPQGYRTAADRLGVAPQACVVVEDSQAGVKAGKRAGMRVVAVRTTHSAAQVGDADLVVGSVDDLRVEPDGDHVRLVAVGG